MTRIAFAQYLPVFGETGTNFRTIERLVSEADSADLLVLPELGTTGYEFRDRAEVASLAEPFSTGPLSSMLRDLAARHQTTLVIGYAERDGNRLYNACQLATPDGSLTNYRKIHLFSRETELFDPGNALPPVVETPAGRVGLMICFDWFFPETSRVLALAGAQVIAHPSNLVLTYCQKAMYARSVENGVFTITANRIGTEDRAGRSLTFTGASQILDHRGNLLASAGANAEAIGTADVDLTQADDKQITPYNHLLNSRRTDLYGSVAWIPETQHSRRRS